jgi:hypothetical protein
MAQAGKLPSTANLPETDESVGDTPPIGKLYEQSIGIQQPQHISLMAWISRLLARGSGIVRGAVAQLPRGRRPYPRPPIIAVAERAIEGGADRSLNAFRDRVRSLLELEIPLAKIPADTVLEEICKPVYDRAKNAKN